MKVKELSRCTDDKFSKWDAYNLLRVVELTNRDNAFICQISATDSYGSYQYRNGLIKEAKFILTFCLKIDENDTRAKSRYWNGMDNLKAYGSYGNINLCGFNPDNDRFWNIGINWSRHIYNGYDYMGLEDFFAYNAELFVNNISIVTRKQWISDCV